MSSSHRQIIFLGLVAHLTAAIFSIGAHHADEIYQIFEFAGYKLGFNSASELPWEFNERMRSGLQPFLVYGFSRFCYLININNPFIIATLIRLIHGLAGFYVSLAFIRMLEREIKSETYRKALWYFSVLFWLLPYFHVRFSSESFGTLLFLLGVLFLNKVSNKKILSFFIAGLLMGFAYAVRFQIGFMVTGLLTWLIFVKKENFKSLAALLFGGILSQLVCVWVDYWLYGEWVLSSWNYLDQNLFHNKASQFGTEPVYYFFTEAFVQLIPPFSLVIMAAMFLFWFKFRSHWITWVSVAFFFLHLPVAHKEIRFLMPLLVFIPFMCVAVFESLANTRNSLLSFIRSKGFMNFAKVFNALALVFICLKPADSSTQRLISIYDQVQGEDALLLFDGDNPYELGSLHYFRKASVRTDYIPADMSLTQKQKLYLFSEAAVQPQFKVIGDRVFYQTYCNFPEWFQYLNFNGWVERAGRYSIYKAIY